MRNDNSLTQQRIGSLDSLRGFAASGVCLYHCCFASEMMPQDAHLSHIAQYGDKGVQVFYILSGFVIPYSLSRRPYERGSAGRFLLGRFARIQPAYWAALAFAVLIYGIVLGRPGFFGLGDLVANAFYMVPLTDSPWLLNVSWTLGVEAQFYILVAFSYPVLTSESPTVRRVAFTLFVLLCFLSRVLPEGRKLPGHFLGKVSYSLYLVHLPVVILVASCLEPLNLVKEHPDLSVVLLFAASVVASVPFYHLAEKPSLAWSRHLRG